MPIFYATRRFVYRFPTQECARSSPRSRIGTADVVRWSVVRALPCGALNASSLKEPYVDSTRSFQHVLRPSSGATSVAGKHPAPPVTLVIFGAAGDLTKRLLMPALYNLSSDGLLDDKMKIIGVNHGELATSAWRDQLTESLKKFAADKAGAFHTSKLDDNAWNWVADRLEYVAGEFETDDVFNTLKQSLGDNGNVIFYLAVSGRFFKTIVERLGKRGVAEGK